MGERFQRPDAVRAWDNPGVTLGGVLTAMVTPFDADGRVDEAGFVNLIHYLLEHGSDGVVVAATTGEGPTLSDDEKLRLWEGPRPGGGGGPGGGGARAHKTAPLVPPPPERNGKR